MSRWKTISITAHYTSQVWVRQRFARAELFDTLAGRILYGALGPLTALAGRLSYTTPRDFLLQRHAIIDALVERAAPAQLVELAAGLSPRGLALAARGVPALDVDLPRMIRLKRDRAAGWIPACYRTAALDLIASDDYATDLGSVLARRSPTIVISEGLIPYFELPLQQRIFARVAELLRACGGGVYLTDVHHQEEVDGLGAPARIFRFLQHAVSRTAQTRMIPNEEQGRRMLAEAGFSSVEVHTPLAWRDELGIPVRERGSGLAIYEATVDP